MGQDSFSRIPLMRKSAEVPMQKGQGHAALERAKSAPAAMLPFPFFRIFSFESPMLSLFQQENFPLPVGAQTFAA